MALGVPAGMAAVFVIDPQLKATRTLKRTSSASGINWMSSHCGPAIVPRRESMPGRGRHRQGLEALALLRVGVALKRRQAGLGPSIIAISWRAQVTIEPKSTDAW